jgi:hypothetical protein
MTVAQPARPALPATRLSDALLRHRGGGVGDGRGERERDGGVARARPGAPLRSLLATGTWWASTGLNVTGSLLHVAALRHGPLSVVQPLGALTLVVAVPLGAAAARRRGPGWARPSGGAPR